MYTVIHKENKWWIMCNGKIMEELGGFIDPITPEIIIEEIKNEV